MNKRLLFGLAVLPFLLGAWVFNDRVLYSRAAWLADYEQLKVEVERSYANLKWARSVKGVDLVALNERTLARLNAANSDTRARAALNDFARAFNDAHFLIESGLPRPVAAVLRLWPRGGEPSIDFQMTGTDVCEALGFSGKRAPFEIEHAGLAEDHFTEFAAGTLDLPNGKRFGIIRIAAFRQHDYAAACERAWQVFRGANGGPCDEDCLDRFSIAVKYEAAAQLAKDATRVTRSAPDGLIIDLTGNGGGTEWVDYAAAAFAPMRLQQPGFAFIRGQHWSVRFEQDSAEFTADLTNSLTAAQNELVTGGLVQARALLDSARVKCELSPIWTRRAYEPDCWNVVAHAPYATVADLTLVAGLTSRSQLMDESVALQQAQPYTGKLYIMVDQHTASAAEQFAAVLRDNGIATVIGTKTMGAGCGYTNGGNNIRLEHSKLTIRMPDCARLRADGGNEYAGITPDIVAEWGATKASKGMALYKALR